jgi:alkylation response protein AidB-like acyl-CoA dehydrogenase
MDFRLTEEQVALRDSVRGYLAATHTPAVLGRLDAAGGRDAEIWQGLHDMGLTTALIPEDHGGLGLGLLEGALLAIELGRANVSEPLVDTALVGVPVLMQRGEVGCLPAILGGLLRIALAHAVNPWIADLDTADVVLTESGMLGGPADPLVLAGADPLRRLFAPVEDAGADPFMLDVAALMAAAQMLGAAEAMLAMATAYARVRTQFGQPIGAFQAVKHLCATAAVKAAFAQPVVLRAAVALQEQHPRASLHVSHAKVAATDAAMLAAETAIQVHGAMGYTYEVDLHYWMKRVWALAGAWGDRAYHARRLDAAVIGGGLPLGPDETFATGAEHG